MNNTHHAPNAISCSSEAEYFSKTSSSLIFLAFLISKFFILQGDFFLKFGGTRILRYILVCLYINNHSSGKRQKQQCL